MTTETTSDVAVALARVARFAGRQGTQRVAVSMTLSQPTATDLAALVPEVAEAARAALDVSATVPARGWQTGDADRIAAYRSREPVVRAALAAALDAHYPGLTQ